MGELRNMWPWEPKSYGVRQPDGSFYFMHKTDDLKPDRYIGIKAAAQYLLKKKRGKRHETV